MLPCTAGAADFTNGCISDNDWKLFGTITQEKRRLGVTTRIGEVFGPLKTENPRRPNRQEIEDAGHFIMTKIAALLPPEFRNGFGTEAS